MPAHEPLEPLVLDVIGPERGGKSDFACTVADYDKSGPVHYLAFDYNYLAPVRRHRALGANIEVTKFHYSLPLPPPTSPKEKGFEDKVNAVAMATRPVWVAFKKKLWAVLSETSKGPIIIDNFTTGHYLCRLALFGYVHKVPRYLYAKRTNEMATILNQIRYSQKNVVLIHRWKEIWDNNDKPTGEFMRDGAFAPTAYEVMATLIATKDDETGRFQVEIRDSTFNDSTVGMVLKGKRRTFGSVANLLVNGGGE